MQGHNITMNLPLHLIVISGHDTGRCLTVDLSTTASIGRGAECSFQLHDAAVSRLHYHASRRSGLIVIRDAESRWGTFVNECRVQEKKLSVGDRVLVGETEFLLTDTTSDAMTMRPRDAIDQPQQLIDVPETSEVSSEPFMNRPEMPSRFREGEAPAEPWRAAPQERRPPRGVDSISGEFLRRSFDQPPSPSKPAESRQDRVASDDDVMRLIDTRYLDYDIRSVIATARTGAVFRAFDNERKREVALKVFWPHLFGEEKERSRLVRSMLTAIPFRHENIVRLYSAGRHRGVCWTSSEIVEGESVAQLISRIGVCGMLDWRRVLRIAIDVAGGPGGGSRSWHGAPQHHPS